MAESTPSIDEICAKAALRNVALRQATKRAAETLTTALKVVARSEDVPEELLPRIVSPAPKLEELLQLIAPETVEEAEPAETVPENANPIAPPVAAVPATPIITAAPARPTVVAAPPAPERKIAFEPVTWPAFGAPEAVKAPAPIAAPAQPPTPVPPALGPNEVFFAPGQLLFSKGDAADRFYVIRQGEVALFEPSAQKQIATLGPGTSFGEQAILVGGVRSVSARAVSGVICLALSAQTLKEMLEFEKGTIKPVFEALLLQLYLHNDLHARGHRYNA